jgi:hypothetical protein
MRIKQGLQTQEQAVTRSSQVDETGEGLSARQWSRIEASKKPLFPVRSRTAELIAKTLGVTNVEDLAKPPKDQDDKSLRDAGYRRIALWLSNDVRLNYRWVTNHYDVSVGDLIDAAPWMFTLLAEMSLADRRRGLEEAHSAFEEAMEKLPDHLAHGTLARSDFENAYYDERLSLARRDVFGKAVRAKDVAEPFDLSETNPFLDFLRRAAEGIDHGALDPCDLDPSYQGGMPGWAAFRSWLHELTGGDSWARFAVENVAGVIGAIPEDLKGEEKTPERIQWLIEKIPPDVRAREEEKRAKDSALQIDISEVLA